MVIDSSIANIGGKTSLDSDIKRLLELGTTVFSEEQRAIAEFGDIRKRIKRGESTGDRIKDFVISNLETLSQDAEMPYRETEARLNSNIGNQILVVKQKEVSTLDTLGYIPFIDSIYIQINKKLELGILMSGLELDIGDGKLIIPTQKYVARYDEGNNLGSDQIGKWDLIEGNISLNWFEFRGLGKEVPVRMHPLKNIHSEFKRGLMIYLGGEVGDYFSRSRIEKENWTDESKKIGKKFRTEKDLDISYVEALNLLGIEVPENFRRKYEEKVYREI